MLFIILLLVCLLLFIIRYKIKHNFWKKRNVLYTDDLTWTFIFEKRSMAEIIKTIYDKYDERYIGTSMGSTPVLILKTIEDIQAVLVSNFQNFYSRGIETNPNDILADNILFMSDYRRWKLTRQMISPMFTSFMLKNMFYIFEKCSRDLVELVEDNQYARKKPFNILYTYTTASIGATIFSIDTQSKNSTMDSPFLEMSWQSVKPSIKTNIRVIIANVFPKLFRLLNLKIFAEQEKFFLDTFKVLLKCRSENYVKMYDYIDISVRLQSRLVIHDFYTKYDLYPTDNMLAAQAFALFIAGADTSANALHFTLLELANNQDILTKVHEEIDSVFGTYREELSYNDIEKLQYLDMVVSESLRMYPPIGFMQRICTKNTVLPGQLTVEKDTSVIIPIFAIHRDSKYYPNPDKFDPERFRDYKKTDKKFTYLPFGDGHRNCIGVKYARLQLKVALAWLLRRFTLLEQNNKPVFERSTFALRDPAAHYQLIVRDIFTE